MKKRIISNTTKIIILVFIFMFFRNYLFIKIYAISSPSMVPSLNVGDAVITIPKKNIEIDDIIAYKTNDRTIIHRVVSIDNNNDITSKGDNNNTIDKEKINQKEILGIVKIKIPYIAYPSIWIRSILEKG